MLEGVDISNNQGAIDWAAVAGAGKRFAFVKATEGTFFRDQYFDQNYDGCRDQQLWRGAYHFARPGRGPSGADEANYFCDYVLSQPALQGDLYIIDLEQDRSQPPPGTDLGAYLLDWCQTTRSNTGVKPLIYSTESMLRTWQCDTEALAEYALWLASWGARWPVWHGERSPFWQYADNGRCPGVQGLCDLDRFGGAEEELFAYGVQ